MLPSSAGWRKDLSNPGMDWLLFFSLPCLCSLRIRQNHPGDSVAAQLAPAQKKSRHRLRTGCEWMLINQTVAAAQSLWPVPGIATIGAGQLLLVRGSFRQRVYGPLVYPYFIVMRPG